MKGTMVTLNKKLAKFIADCLAEFAEYTSAKDRIALGKKSRKAEAAKRREDIQELIADA